MHLALIDKETKKVINIIVPPSGSDAYFLPPGVDGVESETAQIGDYYDEKSGEFIRDPEVLAAEQAAAEQAAKAEENFAAEQAQNEIKKADLAVKRDKIQAAIDDLKSKGDLSIQDEGVLASLENSLENIKQKIG